MINNRYKLLIAGGLIGLTSMLAGCNFDNNKPSGSLPNREAVSSLDLMGTAVRGFYIELTINQCGAAGQDGLYADAKGGDIQAIGRSNNFAPVIFFNCDASSVAAGKTYYVYANLLGKANKVIEESANVADKGKNEKQFNQYLGEAYAARAFGHFELARHYAELPTVARNKDAADSGIPLQMKYNDEKVVQKRNTISETYKAIVEDFEKALTLMDSGKDFDKTQLNYWAATALLSRAYLYMGDYSNALKHAVNVINNSGAKLYTTENYLGSWKAVGADESLFEVATTEKANAQRNSLGHQTNPEGYAEAAASKLFLEFFNTIPDTDIRKQTLTKRSDGGKQEGWYTTKYMGQQGVSNALYVNNARIIRLSEVYLIAAEAALKGGTAAGAQDAVYYYNELRKNRIQDYTPVSSVTIDDLLAERRIEFFCENQRMFDLVRNRKDIQTASVVEGVVKYTDLKRVLMAIPEREIHISKGAMKQNPGW